MLDQELESVRCNLCGEDVAEHFLSQQDLLASKRSFSIVRCTRCELAYVNPRPKLEGIHRYYPDDFFSYQMEVLAPENASLRRRLVSYLANSSASQRVEAVQKLLPLTAQSEVLDVGCGKAGFLYALNNEVGCKVSGLDFDAGSVTYCREKLDLDVRQGGAGEIEGLGREFDLVTMWHFLEHDFDPAGALKSIHKVLRDGQYLLLEVPNVACAENALFGSKSYLYDVPRHLYHFSPVTITRMLEGAGFVVESMKFPHFSGGWIGSLQGLLMGGRVFTDLQGHVFSFFALSLLCLPFDLLTSALGRGSIMTVLARKTDTPG